MQIPGHIDPVPLPAKVTARDDGKVDIMEHPQDLDHPVGMRTGATIHTRKGLHMIVKKREL